MASICRDFRRRGMDVLTGPPRRADTLLSREIKFRSPENVVQAVVRRSPEKTALAHENRVIAGY